MAFSANDTEIQKAEKKRSGSELWFRHDLIFPDFFTTMTLNSKQSLSFSLLLLYLVNIFVHIWPSH